MTLKVVYGHTDSIYVQIDSLTKAKETVEIINEHVRTIFPNILELDEHPVTLEFEKYFHSLGVGATKNRNAGLITWKEGKKLEEMEFTMTGFTAKRVSETKLAKDVQITTLKMWVNGDSEKDIVSYLNNTYEKVRFGNISKSQIIKRSRYRPARFTVVCKTCKRTSDLNNLCCNEKTCCGQPILETSEGKRPTIGSNVEGVLYYNSNNEIPIDDSHLYLKINNTHLKKYFHPIKGEWVKPNFVAELKEADFEKYVPHWDFYADTVVKKAEPIFNAMDWDIKQVMKDSKQKTLEEWF